MQDANELATLLEADDAFDASGSVNLPPLRAGEAIMFARKEEFHVERLKPPMNTRKMVEARGRGPFDCAPRRPGAFRLSPLHAIAATRPKRRGRLPGDESAARVGAVPRGQVRGQAPGGAHEGLVRVGAQARRRRDL